MILAWLCVAALASEPAVRPSVEFAAGDAAILPGALPILDAAVQILAEEPRFAHVVVEGYASSDGDSARNYALAEARARAVFRYLAAHGVALDRLSYRALGESEAGPHAEPLDRVVRFVVTHVLPDGAPVPASPTVQVLPWSGEVVPVLGPQPR